MSARRWVAGLVGVIALIGGPLPAVAQYGQGLQDDPPPHCGSYPDGRKRGCSGSGQGGMEAACMAQARIEICMTYYNFNCQRGFALACRIAAIGQGCYNGNAQQCQYFQQLLAANRACTLDGNQQACLFLRQQGLT